MAHLYSHHQSVFARAYTQMNMMCIKVKKLHYRKRQYQVFILQLLMKVPHSPHPAQHIVSTSHPIAGWSKHIVALRKKKNLRAKALDTKYQNAIVLFNLVELINNAWPNNIKSNFACILTVSFKSYVFPMCIETWILSIKYNIWWYFVCRRGFLLFALHSSPSSSSVSLFAWLYYTECREKKIYLIFIYIYIP